MLAGSKFEDRNEKLGKNFSLKNATTFPTSKKNTFVNMYFPEKAEKIITVSHEFLDL